MRQKNRSPSASPHKPPHTEAVSQLCRDPFLVLAQFRNKTLTRTRAKRLFKTGSPLGSLGSHLDKLNDTFFYFWVLSRVLSQDFFYFGSHVISASEDFISPWFRPLFGVSPKNAPAYKAVAKNGELSVKHSKLVSIAYQN